MKSKQQSGSIRLSDLATLGRQKVTLENVAIWDAEAEALYNILKDATIKDAVTHLEENPPSAGVVAMLWFVAQVSMNKKKAKHAAVMKNSKPDGNYDKHNKIRSIWASGKYTSRDICAEQECAALSMSFSAARKALRNTPDHT
jgi:hypothetical protein